MGGMIVGACELGPDRFNCSCHLFSGHVANLTRTYDWGAVQSPREP